MPGLDVWTFLVASLAFMFSLLAWSHASGRHAAHRRYLEVLAKAMSRFTNSGTFTILAAIAAVGFAQWALLSRGLSVWELRLFAFDRHSWWAFLTWMTNQFAHTGLEHALGNAVFVFGAGLLVERSIGRDRMLAIFLLAGMAGVFLQSFLIGLPARGASSGAAALVGACAVLTPIWTPRAWGFLQGLHAKLAASNSAFQQRLAKGAWGSRSYWRRLIGGGVPLLFFLWVLLDTYIAARFLALHGSYLISPGFGFSYGAWAHLGGLLAGALFGLGYLVAAQVPKSSAKPTAESPHA